MTKHTSKGLAAGCRSCICSERLLDEVVAEARADVEIERVATMSDMVPYGSMSTPSIVTHERVVRAGGIQRKAEVRRWVMALQG